MYGRSYTIGVQGLPMLTKMAEYYCTLLIISVTIDHAINNNPNFHASVSQPVPYCPKLISPALTECIGSQLLLVMT